jgi:hypothetical protein
MPNKEEKKLKAFKIAPSGDSRFDDLYVLADATWRMALSQVELSLENQLNNEKPWEEIKCTIECVCLTQEEWDEISSNE